MTTKPSLVRSLLSANRSDYERAPAVESAEDQENIDNQPNQYNPAKDPYFQRHVTFTRAFTTDIAQSFQRTFTHTFGMHFDDDDTDELWTKRLLETYNEAKNKGVEGDIPLPAEFARNKNFWKAFVIVGLIATFLGLVALVFLNAADFVPRVWANNFLFATDNTYFICPDCEAPQCLCDKYDNCQLYHGQPYWIIITTSTGLLVGILRYVFNYPDNLPGLFKEIATYHVDPKWSPASFLISVVSLSGGLSLGPEQALASVGGGLATYLAERKVIFEGEEAEDYKKLLVLGGMASALGALFPTPLLGVLLILELGKVPKSYMESTLIMSCGACVSFLVYYSLIDYTFIETLNSRGAVFAAKWEFDETQCFTAVAIGIVCAALGISIMLTIGIIKQIFNRIRMRLEKHRLLVCIVPAIIGGAAVGTVNWALPMSIGNGNQVMAPMISYTIQGKISEHLLVCSGFARVFVLAVSMNSGFVGGFVFPLITIGATAGLVCSKMYPSLPMGLCLGCFIAGLPASVCPMPFTLAGLCIFIFYFGLYQTVPIFLSCIVSYTIVVGSGLFGALARRGQAAEMKDSESKKDKVLRDSQAEETKRLEEQYALNHYMQAKEGLNRH